MISVVVPSYRRATSLRDCLLGLKTQTTAPKEIIVVLRDGDVESERVVREVALPNVQVAFVERPGVVWAMHIGSRQCSSDVVAFIDDDAVAPPDWTARLSARMQRDVGAVGGRDRLRCKEPYATEVGRITRWGKLIGNHHLGVGGARDVDVLKAVNMAVKREVLALPDGLRGEGAQNHFEVALSLYVQARGLRVLYDPAIVVDHYPAERHDNDARGNPDAVATRAASFNLVLCLLTFRPGLARRRALYGLLVGDKGCPGLLRGLAAIAKRDRTVVRALLPSLHGQIDALWQIHRGHPARMLLLRGPRLACPT